MGIWTLIFGPPLSHAQSEHERVLNTFDTVFEALALFIRQMYPIDQDELTITCNAMRTIRQLRSPRRAEIMCKRALLLLAIHLDPEVAQLFTDGRLCTCDPRDRLFLSDLTSRILPRTVPMYIRSMCQRPDVFVETVASLHQLWDGESLDTMASPAEVSHTGQAAHHDVPIEKASDRGYRERAGSASRRVDAKEDVSDIR